MQCDQCRCCRCCRCRRAIKPKSCVQRDEAMSQRVRVSEMDKSQLYGLAGTGTTTDSQTHTHRHSRAHTHTQAIQAEKYNKI